MLEPKLRFPQFTDGYEADSLSDVADRVRRKNSENQTDIPLTIASIEGLRESITMRLYPLPDSEKRSWLI